MTTTALTDWERLVGRYLDGTASAEDLARIDEVIAADPEAARSFARTCRVDSFLADHHQESRESAAQWARLHAGGGHRRIRRLSARTRSRRGAALTAYACAAAALLAAGLWWWSAADDRVPQRAETVVAWITAPRSAGATLTDVEGVVRAASVGTGLVRGMRIQTADGDALTFIYAGEPTVVALGAHTSCRIEREARAHAADAAVDTTTDGSKRLGLDSGTLSATVAPQPPGSPFFVRTPQAELTVVGTAFESRVDERATELEVTEGTVAMARLADGESVIVPAGHRAVAAAGVELAAVLITPVATIAMVAPPATIVPADTERIVWKDSFDDLAPWRVTEWRRPGGIVFEQSREVLRTAPGALRLRYERPNVEPARPLDKWIVNARSVDRQIELPPGAERLRLWVNSLSAQKHCLLDINLYNPKRTRCWSCRIQLHQMAKGWILVEADLRKMTTYWTKGKREVLGDGVPPVDPRGIAIIEIALNLADAEVVIDDIEFLSSAATQMP